MSLSTQSTTRRLSISTSRLKKGRKKKVYFPLDKCSLYTIISIMKGRICYASKKRLPDIEKLHVFTEAKSSFLKPVTSRPTTKKPFRLRAAAGSLECRPDIILRSRPVAAFFCSLLFPSRGRFGLPRSLPQPAFLTDHRLFQYVSLSTLWPASVLGLLVVFTVPGRPL